MPFHLQLSTPRPDMSLHLSLGSGGREDLPVRLSALAECGRPGRSNARLLGWLKNPAGDRARALICPSPGGRADLPVRLPGSMISHLPARRDEVENIVSLGVLASWRLNFKKFHFQSSPVISGNLQSPGFIPWHGLKLYFIGFWMPKIY